MLKYARSSSIRGSGRIAYESLSRRRRLYGCSVCSVRSVRSVRSIRSRELSGVLAEVIIDGNRGVSGVFRAGFVLAATLVRDELLAGSRV